MKMVAGRLAQVSPKNFVLLIGLLIGLLIVASPMAVSAADSTVSWTRQFGSWNADYGRATATDSNGDVYVAGYTMGTMPGGGGSSGHRDAYVRKYDAAGDIVWTRQFGTEASEFAVAVLVEPDGGVCVAGNTRGDLPGGEGGLGAQDAFIRKYSASGDLLWTRQFGTKLYDYVLAASSDSAGNIFVAGWTIGLFPDGGGMSGRRDSFVRKYNAQGDVIWTRQFGTPDHEYARGLSTDSDGNVYVLGNTNGVLDGGGGRLGEWDAFIRKYSASGDLLWTRQFGTASRDSVRAAATDSSGSVYLGGWTLGTLDDGGGSSGEWDAYVRKYSPTGDILWTRQFGTASRDSVRAAATDSSGNVYAVGKTWGAMEDGGGSSGGEDILVRKYSPTGDIVWTQQVGSNRNDFAWGSAVDSTANLYVAGYTRGTLPEGGGSSGTVDAFLMRFGASEVSRGRNIWSSNDSEKRQP